MLTSLALADRIGDLLCPDAFPHPARDVRLVETHNSWVILAGDFAYKLRKPVSFGSVAVPTLEQRREDCEREMRLNRRLCPDLYLGLVDVVERSGRLAIGGEGQPVEPALWMQRLPEAAMLPALLERGAADDRLMRRVAASLADFHARAPTGPGVDEHGTRAAMRANWDEKFAQTEALEGGMRAGIRAYADEFLATHADLLHQRVQTGRIRDGHGNLHAGSVCATRRRLYLLDCVEFDARFRCADVAAEVASLAMDLDHLGRADLGAAFVDAYVRYTSDAHLPALLDFYKCYRAFVRGRVLRCCLREVRPEAAEAERISNEASAYFDLAYSYATRSRRPTIIVVMGLPASGKTTLARALAGRLGLLHLSSDVVRKTRRTYAGLLRKAARLLRRGQSVVLDATFGMPADRAAARQLARRTGARLFVLVCRANDQAIRERLEARALDGHSPSDTRLKLWPAVRAAFVEPNETGTVFNADTAQPLNDLVAAVVAAVRASDPEPSSPTR